jgi:hypothetical protein
MAQVCGNAAYLTTAHVHHPGVNTAIAVWAWMRQQSCINAAHLSSVTVIFAPHISNFPRAGNIARTAVAGLLIDGFPVSGAR